MRHFAKIMLTVFLFCISCKDKDVTFYKEQYLLNKDKYQKLSDTLQGLLSRSDRLFKYKVIFTDKRLEEASYVNDSTQYNLEHVKLSYAARVDFDNIMYKLNLNYVVAYRDSIKYVFGGKNKDIIVKYSSQYNPQVGNLIDTNAYMFFEGTRDY